MYGNTVLRNWFGCLGMKTILLRGLQFVLAVLDERNISVTVKKCVILWYKQD